MTTTEKQAKFAEFTATKEVLYHSKALLGTLSKNCLSVAIVPRIIRVNSSFAMKRFGSW